MPDLGKGLPAKAQNLEGGCVFILLSFFCSPSKQSSVKIDPFFPHFGGPFRCMALFRQNVPIMDLPLQEVGTGAAQEESKQGTFDHGVGAPLSGMDKLARPLF